ncbi:MAG: nucleotidyltransferase domain-containing protein [Planctomycetes bacterium]|nr:nucleotidyltransferase domain-containing protein [Planctomycetota bacterium]
MPRIAIPQIEIASFCKQKGIRKLSLFGSVLRDDFTDESDIDVLVVFEPNARVGLIKLAGLEIELSEILGRKAEIHTIAGLPESFRDEVLAEEEVDL